MKLHLRTRGVCCVSLLALFAALAAGAPALRGQAAEKAQVTHGPAQLTISGDVQKPLTLSLSELRALPRKTISVNNEHAGENETYEGVALAALLKQAGVPQGIQVRGKAMAIYVLAEAADGYRVIFSLAELDTDFENSEVIVADTLDGKPLGDNFGPLRLVAPHDKRPARWVRMLQSIQVVNVK